MVGDKLQGAAKMSCCYDKRGKYENLVDLTLGKNKSKRDYDKNNNNVLDEAEWYDWKTDKSCIQG